MRHDKPFSARLGLANKTEKKIEPTSGDSLISLGAPNNGLLAAWHTLLTGGLVSSAAQAIESLAHLSL